MVAQIECKDWPLGTQSQVFAYGTPIGFAAKQSMENEHWTQIVTNILVDHLQIGQGHVVDGTSLNGRDCGPDNRSSTAIHQSKKGDHFR